MADYDVLFVNPLALTDIPTEANVGPIFTAKKIVNRSINPGILSMASFLNSKGYQIKIIDLSCQKNTKLLEKELEKESPLIAAIIAILKSLPAAEQPAHIWVAGSRHFL
jgi:hypothetical protein